MSDQDRIRAMREAGKLSPEEAERLLAALDDIEAAESDLNAAEKTLHEPESETSQGFSAAETQTTTQQASASVQASQEDGFNWVRVSLLAGDIDAFVDPALSEPSILKGNAEVKRDGNNFVIRAAKRINSERMAESRQGFGNFLDEVSDLVSGVSSRFGDLKLALPQGYALEVESKAGDIDVKGVRFLKARLMAGDVDAEDIGGIDIAAGAGDIDIRFRPVSGKHRIQATAGDVDVTLLKGSSVSLEASVGIGEIDIYPHAKVSRRGIGGSVSERIGEGAAQLGIQLSTGDLDIKVDD